MTAPELDHGVLLPLLRESLKPLELLLGAVIRSGSEPDMETIVAVVGDLLAYSIKMQEARKEHECNLH